MVQRDRLEVGRRAASRTRLFGTSLLATLLVSFLPLPWRLSGLAFGMVALWSGVRLLRDLSRLRRLGRPVGGFVGVWLGIGLCAFVMLGYLSEAVLYPMVSDLDRCQAGAVTHLAADQCQQTFDQRVQEIANRLQGLGTTRG
jgi:hypothetical protein